MIEQGLGHEVPPPDRRRDGPVRAPLRLRRDTRRRAGTAARPRSGHRARSCASSATTTPASTPSPRPRRSSTGGHDVPSVIPPAPDARRPVLLGRVAEGRLVFQRCADVRHGAPPAGTDVRRVPIARVGHAGVDRPGHRVHLDRVAPPDRARRRAARRRPGGARRGHPLRRRTCSTSSSRRRAQRAWRSSCASRTIDGVLLPSSAPSDRGGSVMAALARHRDHRRHRPDRVLQGLGAQRAAARGRGGRAAIADAGLTPADIDGMVTFTIDTQRRARAHALPRHPGAAVTGRARRGGGGGAYTTVQHASLAVASGAANAVLVYRAFNERSGRRFGQPNSSTASRRRAGTGTCRSASTRRPRCTRSGSSATCTSYGVTNEDFGRYTVVAREHAATNPNAWFYERPITLDDHQAVALDRRADPAHARLLPGERRRRRARRHHAPTAPATCRTAPVRIAAVADGHLARRQRDVQLLPRRPRRVPGGRVPRRGSSTRRPGSRPTTSTWR